jgi:hypothetical protein
VSGTVVASGFEINRTDHPTDLLTGYVAQVNGFSGDVLLEDVRADFLRPSLSIDGAVQGTNGKTVSLQFRGRQARNRGSAFDAYPIRSARARGTNPTAC